MEGGEGGESGKETTTGEEWPLTQQRRREEESKSLGWGGGLGGVPRRALGRKIVRHKPRLQPTGDLELQISQSEEPVARTNRFPTRGGKAEDGTMSSLTRLVDWEKGRKFKCDCKNSLKKRFRISVDPVKENF